MLYLDGNLPQRPDVTIAYLLHVAYKVDTCSPATRSVAEPRHPFPSSRHFLAAPESCEKQ